MVWAERLTAEEIADGRRREEEGRRGYYDALDRKRRSVVRRLWRWISGLFQR